MAQMIRVYADFSLNPHYGLAYLLRPETTSKSIASLLFFRFYLAADRFTISRDGGFNLQTA